MITKNRRCPNCDRQIKGRMDKIYCSVACKSAHQYQNRLENEEFYFKVDRQLKLNRKLLKRYNLHGKTTLRRTILNKAGFDPNFFTHYWKNKEGQVYFFCYDYGFLKIKEEQFGEQKSKYLIVQWQSYMENQ